MPRPDDALICGYPGCKDHGKVFKRKDNQAKHLRHHLNLKTAGCANCHAVTPNSYLVSKEKHTCFVSVKTRQLKVKGYSPTTQ